MTLKLHGVVTFVQDSMKVIVAYMYVLFPAAPNLVKFAEAAKAHSEKLSRLQQGQPGRGYGGLEASGSSRAEPSDTGECTVIASAINSFYSNTLLHHTCPIMYALYIA